MQRRDFLKLTSSITSLSALSALGIPLSLFGSESDSLIGYKALVVIVQKGGNDSLNMFVPSGGDVKKGYDNYASVRTTLAVVNNDLSNQLTQADGKLDLSTNPYALNGKITHAYTKGFYKHVSIDGLATNGIMPELANLVNQGKVAMVANTGNLIEPVSRTQILEKTANIPPYLYSHNSQQRLVFNGIASSLRRQGWAGLLADKWNTVNSGSIYGMNISLRGVSHLLYGESSEPLSIRASGPTKYSSIKRVAYDDWLATHYDDTHKNLYNIMRKHSFEMQDTIVDDWENSSPTFTSKNAYGGELFSLPSNSTLDIAPKEKISDLLLQQLKAVAKLAYIGKNRGLKRQIFYVERGGYDNHANQAENHSLLLRELSMGLGDLQLALADMGMENDVTTFNLSEFGRSIGNNGDGTDHGWGAHHFVMGEAVRGGLYGTLPDLTLGGDDDASQKGRLIPSTSMSQYLGTIVKWFGADDTLLNNLFPERNNFASPDLGFMG